MIVILLQRSLICVKANEMWIEKYGQTSVEFLTIPGLVFRQGLRKVLVPNLSSILTIGQIILIFFFSVGEPRVEY